MKHQTIYKKLGISYKNYTKLRNKYRFFAYITDLLTMDYLLNLDIEMVDGLVADLQEMLRHKGILRGLDVALFANTTCFKPDNLAFIRNCSDTVNRYQMHKWHYSMGTYDVDL
ncbi:MAG: hypothetical protein KBD37_05530 [Burkholderiales bacterium]|nr:hypothetical protein [Burkholderiales bacterium]